MSSTANALSVGEYGTLTQMSAPLKKNIRNNMNQQGIDYLKEIERKRTEYNQKRNTLPETERPPEIPKYQWTDSQVQERCMRLGVEARIFELDPQNTSDMEKIAIATLHEDFLNK